MPTPAILAGRSSTMRLVGIVKLTKLLLLQGGQFLILLSGIVTVNNLAGGKFFCTENALVAVPSAASTAMATVAGMPGHRPALIEDT